MTAALIVIPGVSYFIASLLYAKQGNWPLAVVYLGYFLGNGGLLWLDLQMR
jgi:hypothetical protein